MGKRIRWGAAILVVAGSCMAAGCASSASSAPTPTPAPSATVAPATPKVFPTSTPVPTYAVPAGTPIPAGAVAARVNGLPVSLRDYERERENYMRQLWQVEHVDPASPEGLQAIVQDEPKLLEMLVARVLVLGYARAHHLTVTAAEVKTAMAQNGGQAAVQRQLAAAKLTMQDYTDNLTVTKTELAIVNGHSYATVEYHVRQILVATLAQANAIYTQLLHHADFAKLAGSQSIDKTSKAQGGDLGFQTTLSLGPTLGPVVAKLALNTQSKPVHSSLGYHIVEVLNVLKDVPPTGNALAQAKLQYWDQWYAALRSKAHVQVLVKFK